MQHAAEIAVLLADTNAEQQTIIHPLAIKQGVAARKSAADIDGDEAGWYVLVGLRIDVDRRLQGVAPYLVCWIIA